MDLEEGVGVVGGEVVTEAGVAAVDEGAATGTGGAGEVTGEAVVAAKMMEAETGTSPARRKRTNLLWTTLDDGPGVSLGKASCALVHSVCQ